MKKTPARGRSHLANSRRRYCLPMTLGPRTRDHTPLTVGLIGLGVIGRVHREVLRRDPRFSLTFIADGRAAALPAADEDHVVRYDGLDAALRAIESGELTAPDLFVLATPTPAHLDHVARVLSRTDARVLCEKPLTSSVPDLERFEDEHRDADSRLAVVNHFGFSPEVTWGVELATSGQWGPPRTFTCSFNDPYVVKSPAERATYVSSWIDSGPNQLAVLRRFTTEVAVVAHSTDGDGARSVTQITHHGGTGFLASNWCTGSSSKQTFLQWDSGRELVLDHTAMTGIALEADRPVEHFGNDGSVDRKVAHYAAMYDAFLTGQAPDLLSLGFAREIAQVLHSAAGRRRHRCPLGARLTSRRSCGRPAVPGAWRRADGNSRQCSG
jgi:predicted dehydrogenase